MNWRRKREDDLNAEIRSHLEMSARDHDGDTAAAQREMGNTALILETTRDAWRWSLADQFLRDLRYGLRGLARNPGFTAVAIIALMLGIGANSAIFSVVNSILLRPLGYRDADRLAVILHSGRNPVGPANFVDWRAQNHVFERMGAAEYWTPDLTEMDRPEKLWALRVSYDILPMLGVPPMMGRVFLPEEDAPGREHEVVIAYGLWQRRFGGDPQVLGRQMTLSGAKYSIVGVMPPEFQFAPFWATKAEMWAPLALGNRVHQRGGNSLRVFARLAPGVSFEQAKAEMATITARMEQEYPGTNRHVTVMPLKEKVVGNVRPALLMLLGAVGLLLLISCANVAHMLLARAAARQREVAIRAALGAGRLRLIRQFLTESLALALAGGAAGLLLAHASLRALIAFGPANLPRLHSVTLDARVLWFTLAVSLFTGVVFGLAPAFQASRSDPAESLKEGGRSSTSGPHRLRGLLVSSEFALALVLLIGAGLLLRSFIALHSIDPGFDPRHVLSMAVSVAGSPDRQPDQRSLFYRQTLERVRALPGVECASYINHLPIAGDVWGWPFWIAGRPLPQPGDELIATYRVVLPGYFQAMGIPILRGRDIADTDTLGAPGTVLVNEYLARQHWPGQDAVGQRITLDNPAQASATPSQWFTVVGVVKNAAQGSWSVPDDDEVYLPYLQNREYLGKFDHYMTLVIRAKGDPGTLAPSTESAIWSLDRNVTISQVQTMEQVVAAANAQPRFYVWLLAAFSAVAATLAAIGIYGVMSYAVSLRRAEIGLRMALGARHIDVLRMVAAQGLTLALAGAAAGLAGALALTRLISNLLFGIQPNDPSTFVIAPAILLIVALAACIVPARRAARVSPMIALRGE